jgi:hypothetical protein
MIWYTTNSHKYRHEQFLHIYIHFSHAQRISWLDFIFRSRFTEILGPRKVLCTRIRLSHLGERNSCEPCNQLSTEAVPVAYVTHLQVCATRTFHTRIAVRAHIAIIYSRRLAKE